MIVVGALLGVASNGVRPVDGGVAVWRDGIFEFGLAEERATREKYAGGFRASLSVALRQLDLSLGDVDAFAFSSYGEPYTEMTGHILEQAPELEPYADRVHIAGRHHDAHAVGAASLSPWLNSLVVVLDNEGLILGAQTDGIVERNPMERASYYVASADSVDLITRDLFGRRDVSIGEAYRRFTYYCGFPSHQFAGKTMALASYGMPNAFGDVDLFSGGRSPLTVNLDQGYTSPSESVVNFFSSQGMVVAPPRDPGGPFERDHFDAAAFVQWQMEKAVTARVRYLLEATGQQTLCLTGGVAYNCKLVGHLEKELGVPVFVPPSPGDQGLAIGAVLSYLYPHGRGIPGCKAEARIGGIHPCEQSDVTTFADTVNAQALFDLSRIDVSNLVVNSLRRGSIVAIVEGRSEFGRRALGARSLLALPGTAAVERLRDLKRREWFRPFGVSVLGSTASQIFIDGAPDRFMLRTREVSAGDWAFSSIIHVDGTLRAQWVEDEDPSILGLSLKILKQLGMEGLVVNTSFNLDGEPIVERDHEALEHFAKYSEIETLVLTNSGCVLTRRP